LEDFGKMGMLTGHAQRDFEEKYLKLY